MENFKFHIKNSISEEILNQVYDIVFRNRTERQGFVVLDYGKNLNSVELRKQMVDLKKELSSICKNKLNRKLNYQWMGRFNQQQTTKFHRDNAAEQSYLMLGYEPSNITSKLYIADYSKFIEDKKISAEKYFSDYNPIFTEGEKLLEPYITEITEFPKEHFKIVLINNSNSINTKTLGVLHKAEIVNKDENEDRVINSTMLYLSELDKEDAYSDEKQLDFIHTDIISQ